MPPELAIEPNLGQVSAPQKPRALVLAIWVYFLTGLVLLPFYMHQINPDGIAYIAIARQYQQGSIWTAINVHWPPFYSWLLTPLIALSIDPLLASKLIGLALGGTVLLNVWRLSAIMQLNPILRNLAVGVSVPLGLSWSLSAPVTPDLLLTTLILWYASVLLQPHFFQSRKTSALAGIIGGLAFLAKSYSLPFFFASFFIISLWRGWSEKLKPTKLLGHLLIGFAAFLLVAAPWVVLISIKHGKPTLGTSGAFNFGLIAPKNKGNPAFDRGLTSPVRADAIHLWEDPSKIRVQKWSPFSSRANAAYYAKKIIDNAGVALGLIGMNSPFAMGLTVSVMLILLSRCMDQKGAYSPQLGLLLIAAIYISGYILIFVEDRYVWVVKLPFILLEIYFIEALLEKKLIGLLAGTVLAFVVVVPIVVYGVRDLYHWKDDGKKPYELSQNLPDLRGCQVASDCCEDGRYLYFCYYKAAIYHGYPSLRNSKESIEQQLGVHRVEYFFQSGQNPPPPYLARYNPEKVMGNEQFQLFKLHQNTPPETAQ